MIPTPLPIVLGYPFLFFFNHYINWNEMKKTITVGKREQTVLVAQSKGLPLQTLMENGVTYTQQAPAELDDFVADSFIPPQMEDVQIPLVLEHSRALALHSNLAGRRPSSYWSQN